MDFRKTWADGLPFTSKQVDMAYSCDPIIECNLNVGTIFSGPFEGKECEWEIVERLGNMMTVKLSGDEVYRNYSVNQFIFNEHSL